MGNCLKSREKNNQGHLSDNLGPRKDQYNDNERELPMSGRQEVQMEDDGERQRNHAREDVKMKALENELFDKEQKARGRLFWKEFNLERPNYVSYLCALPEFERTSFLACADKDLLKFEVDEKNEFRFSFGLHSCFQKAINMCTLLNEEKVIACSMEPVVKIFDLRDEGKGQGVEFTGHDRSVTSVAASPSQTRMVSGSKDQTTRLWDVETQKQLFSKKIERNVITYLKWLPNNADLFIECSEDLSLRLWDIKMRPFKAAVEFKVGANFATTCDILSCEGEDLYLVTGHRGFNNEGSDVKLWDLRSFSQENLVFTYRQHTFSPQSVRFHSGMGAEELIISAGADQMLHAINLEGQQIDAVRHEESLSGMATFAGRKSVVCADVKGNVVLYELEGDGEERQLKRVE